MENTPLNPAINWRLLDTRRTDEKVRAYRWVRHFLNELYLLPAKTVHQQLAHMDNSTLIQVAGRTKVLSLMGIKDGPIDHLSHLNEWIDSELQIRELIAPGSLDWDMQKSNAVDALWDEYAKLEMSHTQQEQIESSQKIDTVLSQIKRIRHMPPENQQEEDLITLEVFTLGQLAALEIGRSCFQEAEDIYKRAINIAEEAELHGLANQYLGKLIDMWSTKSSSPQLALQALLKLKSERENLTEPLSLIQINERLVTIYQNMGNVFEAQKLTEKMRSELVQMGFPDPSNVGIASAVEQWLIQAEKLERVAPEFERVFSGVLVAFLRILMVRISESTTAHEEKATFELHKTLSSTHSAYIEKKQQILAEDEQFMALEPDLQKWQPFIFDAERIDINDTDEKESNTNTIPTIEEIQAIGERLDKLRAREQSGECGPDLESDISAELEGLSGEKYNAEQASLRDILGDVYLTREDYDLALEQYASNVEFSKQHAAPLDIAYYAQKQIVIHLVKQEHDEVLKLCRETIDYFKKERFKLVNQLQDNAFATYFLKFFGMAAIAALKQGDITQVAQWLDEAKAGGSLLALSTAFSDLQNAKVQRLLEEIYTFEMQKPNGQALSEEEAEKRKLLYERWALEKRIHSDEFVSTTFELPRIQHALAENEVILAYFWLDKKILAVIAIDKNTIDLSREMIDEEAFERLHQFILKLDDMKGLHLDIEELQSFGAFLLPESLHFLLKNKDHILVSPHHLLHAFPFHLLEWQDDYFFKHAAISFIPNIASLLVDFPESDADGTLLMGVSDFNINGMHLSRLPGVDKEVSALDRMYLNTDQPAKKLTNDEIMETAFRKLGQEGSLGSYKVLHLATHGEDVLDLVEDPMKTRLFLADGWVDALEISSWKLSADLVVLSACHSGRRAYQNQEGTFEFNGDEIFGMQAAFFKAGVPCLLGALWPADDDVTQQLMLNFHQFLLKYPPEKALQLAMKTFLDGMEQSEKTSITNDLSDGSASRDIVLSNNEQNSTRKNPAFWAPFFITRIGKRRV